LRKEALLVLLAVVISLVAAEGLLRAFPRLLLPLELQIALDDSPETRGVSHPYIGYLQAPHGTLVRTREFEISYPTDAHGFNNADPWPARADIVAVGDSLTFGYGVAPNQAWPALIARDLPDTKVINLGVIGAGPQQYLRVYETFGAQLEPKILLIGFFLANDFWDAEMFDTWLKSGVGGNYLVWRDFGRATDARSAFLPTAVRRSYLYNWARFIRQSYRNWRAREPKDLQLADGSHLKLRPDDLAQMTAYVEPGNPIFDLTLDALERINAIATSHGTHVLVVLQPSKEETYLPLLDGTIADPGAPLRAELKARGIEYLDLLPAFREHAVAGAKLFYEFDGHPNAEGYRLIAEQVLAHLESNAGEYGLRLRMRRAGPESSSLLPRGATPQRIGSATPAGQLEVR
jgi:lysophospholipase L1-like esterase